MQDQLLTCQNCGNPFVYSVYEQQRQKQSREHKNEQSTTNSEQSTMNNKQYNAPQFCPICTAIKQSETKHPAKPKK